jgi:hypothetical protein
MGSEVIGMITKEGGAVWLREKGQLRDGWQCDLDWGF